MADELPEKVREALRIGPLEGAPYADGQQDCEDYEQFARRIAHLAIEESTRSIREKLENAEEGYARRHKDATDLWEKINFPGGLNAQILELRERLERSQSFVRTYSKLRYNGLSPDVAIAALESTDHALAIREAKESAHV